MTDPTALVPLTRRTLLGRAGALFAALPFLDELEGAGLAEHSRRRLLVVELRGGNDGLNTVVPVEDPAYRRARPKLALTQSPHDLGRGFRLHPRMGALMRLWRDGSLAVVHGVGYPQQDRSHFRARDVWHSARPDLEVPQRGWLGSAAGAAAGRGLAPALALGTPQLPLCLRDPAGCAQALPDLAALALAEDPRAGRGEARRRELEALQESARPDRLGRALARLARTTLAGAARLREALASWRPAVEFPQTDIGQKLALAARAFEAPLGLRIAYVAQPGYDTHAGQSARQARLLGELASALAAFAAELEQRGLFDDTLVFVFSEFGRRLAENRSGGTDHGKANVVLAAGGRVRGGHHGEPPSLEDLDGGDPAFTTDFRSLYCEILESWLAVPARGVLNGAFPPVGLLR